MDELIADELNLKILQHICSGDGLSVNISELSHTLRKHRNTIRDRVDDLFSHEIINRPVYPFFWLYTEYPLMVIARADLPRDEITNKFIEEDPHIFAAFFKKDEEYNTLLIEYHKDIYSHLIWRDAVTKEGKLPPRENRYPSDALFFSNKTFIKYHPEHLIDVLEREKKKHNSIINGYKLDDLSFDILKKLIHGEGIRTNEHHLSVGLGVHRKTIERRIKDLCDARIILRPVCRFPRFMVLPDYTLVISLIEIKKHSDAIIKAWQNDPNVPFILRVSMGRYTHMIYSNFYRIRDHLEWEEEYNQRFLDCIGAIKNIYLSPSMMFSINQQYVSLGIIEKRLNKIRGKKLVVSMKSRGETTDM